MKKLLGIVVLGLMFCNLGYAISLSDLDQLTGNQINTALNGKKLSGFYTNKKSFVEIYYPDKKYEFFSNEIVVKGKWKIKRNKMCYKEDGEFSYDCVGVYKGINNGKVFYYFVENNEIVAGAGVISSVSGETTTNKKYAQSGKDIVLKCSNSKNGTKSLIINEEQNKIILDGYRVTTPIIWGTIINFMSPDPNVYDSKFSHHKEVTLDRITGQLNAPNYPSSFDRIAVPRFQCVKVKALF